MIVMPDILMAVLRRVPQLARAKAIHEATADRRDEAVLTAAREAQDAALNLHNLASLRSGRWNGTERRRNDRRFLCGDCPHKT